MKEKNIKRIEKEVLFEGSEEGIKISITLINVKYYKQIEDSLEKMFKEIKESII
ncbi:hypothetical protein QTH09_00145 [Clostridium perfringens]|nr:hypothetical protein [Clostridium perfringens]